ncbi:MAG: hypothetical protein OXG05_10805 [Gammaproteobacteria bacterium]|nr:hypothetical protein [Gammaproteobacteria bacterium]
MVNHGAIADKKRFETVVSPSEQSYPARTSAMQMVFRDGDVMNCMSFDDVRNVFLSEYRSMSV